MVDQYVLRKEKSVSDGSDVSAIIICKWLLQQKTKKINNIIKLSHYFKFQNCLFNIGILHTYRDLFFFVKNSRVLRWQLEKIALSLKRTVESNSVGHTYIYRRKIQNQRLILLLQLINNVISIAIDSTSSDKLWRCKLSVPFKIIGRSINTIDRCKQLRPLNRIAKHCIYLNNHANRLHIKRLIRAFRTKTLILVGYRLPSTYYAYNQK